MDVALHKRLEVLPLPEIAIYPSCFEGKDLLSSQNPTNTTRSYSAAPPQESARWATRIGFWIRSELEHRWRFKLHWIPSPPQLAMGPTMGRQLGTACLARNYSAPPERRSAQTVPSYVKRSRAMPSRKRIL